MVAEGFTSQLTSIYVIKGETKISTQMWKTCKENDWKLCFTFKQNIEQTELIKREMYQLRKKYQSW